MGIDSELPLKVGFSMMKGVSANLYRQMKGVGLTLEDFFRFDAKRLHDALGISASQNLSDEARAEALNRGHREAAFMKQHGITGHFIDDEDYPWRLLDIGTPPLLLYKIGECDLNQEHGLSIVGTRHCTAYGAEQTERLVKDMSDYFSDLCIVSGLAYGIDAVAHTSALKNGRPTIGIVAHGLHTIYPAAHRDLARNIIKSGGAIVAEYPSNCAPYRNRFLERNRIVACISQAVVVIESAIKGGAMSTANDAFSYSRDVFAIPGRANDPQSGGTNHLIRKHKAELITSATDIMESLGWQPAGVRTEARQRTLFPELDEESRKIYDVLRYNAEPQSLDNIHIQTKLPVNVIMAALSEMEFDGIVIRMPGNRYSLA